LGGTKKSMIGKFLNFLKARKVWVKPTASRKGYYRTETRVKKQKEELDEKTKAKYDEMAKDIFNAQKIVHEAGFKMNAYAQTYFDAFGQAYAMYGDEGVKTQILYLHSNLRPRGEEQKYAKKLLLKMAQGKIKPKLSPEGAKGMKESGTKAVDAMIKKLYDSVSSEFEPGEDELYFGGKEISEFYPSNTPGKVMINYSFSTTHPVKDEEIEVDASDFLQKFEYKKAK